MSRSLVTVSLAIAAVFSACATSPGLRCGSGEQRLVSDTLYFGTERPGGIVTSAEWSEFLAAVVTPRFPEGLSVWQASGQWRSAIGAITNESSHVLSLMHPATEAAESSIRAIVAEYKNRFQQEAVLRVKSDACVSF